jgi:phage gp29-like protein
VLVADSHLQGEIEKRFLAVLGDDHSFHPADKSKPEDVAAAKVIEAAVERMPDFLGLCSKLLWGCIWPVSLASITYKPAPIGSGLTWDWNDLRHVSDQLLTWHSGELQIWDTDCHGRRSGKAYTPNQGSTIIHRGHLLPLADFWGGPMRALVWWFFLKHMDREWWVRFLDKFGQPFVVAKFDKGRDADRQILERALRMANRIGGLVVTRETMIELQQAQSQGPSDAFQAFYELCNREISKRVVGQTMSAEAQSSGMGSGQANLHSAVRGDIRAWDGKRLGGTLREQLFRRFLRLNGLPGQPPHIRWGGDEPEELTAISKSLADFKTAGIRIADDSLAALGERFGFQLERDDVQPASIKPGLKALSAATRPDPQTAASSISRDAAAMLSQSMRGSLAPARQIILSSSTPAQAESALLALFADWTPAQVAETIDSAITAGAWNGIQA